MNKYIYFVFIACINKSTYNLSFWASRMPPHASRRLRAGYKMRPTPRNAFARRRATVPPRLPHRFTYLYHRQLRHRHRLLLTSPPCCISLHLGATPALHRARRSRSIPSTSQPETPYLLPVVSVPSAQPVPGVFLPSPGWRYRMEYHFKGDALSHTAPALTSAVLPTSPFCGWHGRTTMGGGLFLLLPL